MAVGEVLNMYEREIAVLEQMLKEPLCRLDGICVNFLNATGQSTLDAFPWEDVVRSWPKFSGSSIYPIPSPIPQQPPAEAYDYAVDMWDGPYGELRKELLQHIINELKRLDDEERSKTDAL